METELKEQLNNVTQSLTAEETATIKEMIATGVLFGRKQSKTNPKMAKYIFSYSKGIAIFDLLQTINLLDQAIVFLKDVVSKKLPVLVVGTQPAVKDLVENFAKQHGFAFVNERWLGGTLTNFKTISKRVDYFKQLKADKETGQLEKYTKKERLLMDREITRMTRMFAGIENLTQLPFVLLLIDAEAHETAVREAKLLKIPMIAVMNNDNNPEPITYPVPANDNLRSSLIWILDRISKGLELVKSQSPTSNEQ